MKNSINIRRKSLHDVDSTDAESAECDWFFYDASIYFNAHKKASSPLKHRPHSPWTHSYIIGWPLQNT